MEDDLEPLAAVSPDVQVQIRFVTKLDLAIPESQFAVPDKLARYGLSEIINHLLDQTGRAGAGVAILDKLSLRQKYYHAV